MSEDRKPQGERETPPDTGAELKRLALMDKVQLVIAVSAILISAASFYATYLQAQSEAKQVKAATWPYLQLSSDNYDTERREMHISYRVQNAGVGPAMVKEFHIAWQGKDYPNIGMMLADCCGPEPGSAAWLYTREHQPSVGDVITGVPTGKLLPAGGEELVFSLRHIGTNAAFWDRVNAARADFEARACYCSLLDQCFETDFKTDPVQVALCQAPTTRL